MGLFTRDYKGSLPSTPAWPSLCTKLSILHANDSLARWGPQLLRFAHLRELYIGWYSGTQATIDSLFPPELAQLRTLRRVTLLNVPLAEWPTWLIDLPNLQHLVVRGTGLICQLEQLRTLRVENCRLTTLPGTMCHMTKLRELGLSDTEIRDWNPAQFPPQLKRLWFHGSGCYVRQDVAQLQQALKGTTIWPDLSHPSWPPESR